MPNDFSLYEKTFVALLESMGPDRAEEAARQAKTAAKKAFAVWNEPEKKEAPPAK